MANQQLWDILSGALKSGGRRIGQGIGAGFQGLAQLGSSGGTAANPWSFNPAAEAAGLGAAVRPLSNYVGGRVPATIQPPRRPLDANAGMGMGGANPQQGFQWITPSGGGQPQQPDYGGMADYLRAMKEVSPPTFAEGMQGAMGQIGSVLQGNANRTTTNRLAAMDYDARMAELAARERLGMYGIGAITGQMPEQYVTGQRRVAGVPMVGPQGPVSGGYSYEPTYGLRFGGSSGRTPTGPSVTGRDSGISSALAAQDTAGKNIYESILGAAGPAAFSRTGTGAGYQFASPGGTFGGATLPGGASMGTAETGVGAQPGQVWGPQYAEEAAKRIAEVGNAAAPYAGGPGATGLATQFQDYLRGAGAGLYGNLARAGERGEATQRLESQVARSRLQNALQQLMAQIYGSQLGTATDDQSTALRMLNALA